MHSRKHGNSMKQTILFQGRWVKVSLLDLDLQRSGKSGDITCAKHSKTLKGKKEIETHLKLDHWPALSKLWLKGKPAN